MLKLVKSEVTPAVTHIVNLSIQNSVFPSLWKHSKVIPLLKPGSDDKLAPKSYRPVALLPVVSKVLERVAFIQTVQYMNKHSLIKSTTKMSHSFPIGTIDAVFTMGCIIL